MKKLKEQNMNTRVHGKNQILDSNCDLGKLIFFVLLFVNQGQKLNRIDMKNNDNVGVNAF